MTKNLFNPYQIHILNLKEQFSKALNTANPAIFLYENNARTPCFMLEALTRLHKSDFKKSKQWEKWYLRFKKLEDLLGTIDFYDGMLKTLEKKKILLPHYSIYLIDQKQKSCEALNHYLTTKKWFSKKLDKFSEFITHHAPLNFDEAYKEKIAAIITKEIEAIYQFVKEANYSFSDLENQVHELRRKVRWISMYANAFNGIIQLKKSTKIYTWEKKYVTKAIIALPFNKLSPAPKNTINIFYNRTAFYALSWLINELGTIKDKGLFIEALEHYLSTAISNTRNQATILNVIKKQPSKKTLLTEASLVTKNFFETHNVLKYLTY